MEKTMTTGKLENLGAESRFTYGGVEWVILDRRPNIALCLAADVLEERTFDDEGKNDFAASSLRAYLNGDFVKKMIEAGASEDAFGSMVLDLTSDDGLEDYGTDRVKVGLLTCDMYRHFRKVIPNASNWWWTATPYSTERNGYAGDVRGVYSDGTLGGDDAYFGCSGVRPLCVLKSEILVSYDEEQIKEYSHSSFAAMIGKLIAEGLRDGIENTNNQIKADKIKVEAAEGDEAHKRAEAVDMMKHIAAAFDIPATIDEEPEEESHAEYAKELHDIYAALLEAGFTEPQAWEIFMHNVRSAQ